MDAESNLEHWANFAAGAIQSVKLHIESKQNSLLNEVNSRTSPFNCDRRTSNDCQADIARDIWAPVFCGSGMGAL